MKKKLRRIALKLDYWLAGICFYIFRLLPLQDKVVASTFRGRRYGDNPKFIVEELHRLNPEVDIVWLKNRHFSYELPPYIRTVSFYHHIQKAYELATARVWVYSHRLEGNIRKRKGQLFIETWHGGLGIKRIEGDALGDTVGEKDKKELGNTVKLADLFISNSDHLSGIYRRAFQYTGPIWKCGYPKNDILFREHNSIRHKVRMTYGLSDDVKIMLYAPTFRDSFEQGGFDSRPYEIDLERVRNALSERFGGQWRILLRWHPVMAEKMEKNGFGISENVNDATEYPDMQELIVASDAFVSDYSSCIFDAALNGIPSYIYAADFDEYAGERGTYYSLEELPFPYAEDNDEMVANILAYDEEKYKNRWDDFSKRTGLFETGHAGNDIARLIHEFLSDNGISVFDFIKKATGSVDTSAGNIVLFGLPYDNNLGDQAIFKCTHSTLKNLLSELGKGGVEIRCVDMTGRTDCLTNPLRQEFLVKYSFRIARRICWLIRSDRLYGKLKYKEAYFVIRRLCEQYIDGETKAVIFAGGGILKFKYQMFQRYIDAVTRYAEKKRIPILMNAVGVEGYDPKSRECRILKKALNRKCVRYISTRDDIKTLKKDYCANRQITKKVADPACSISDFIPKKRKQTDKITIGLGVVREGLFSDNGIDMSREEMLAFWSELYAEIEKRGFDCKLFGNGALSDQKFLEDLLKYMRISRKDWEKVAYRRPVSVEDLVDIINSFDGIIAGRLHAAVIAYSYNVPAVELVWNNKQLMFGQAIGFPERFVPAGGSDVRHLVDLMERAIREGYNNEAREEYCRTTANFMKTFIKNYIN